MEFRTNCWTNYTDRRKPKCCNKNLSQHQFFHHILHEWACPVSVNQNLTYILNQLIKPTCMHLLTPWSRVLLEKLTVSAASQEIPRIFGTRMFLTVLTSARHMSLSWANSTQSPQLPPTSWRSILILSSHLRLGLPNGLFPSGFPKHSCTRIEKQQTHKTSSYTFRHSVGAILSSNYKLMYLKL